MEFCEFGYNSLGELATIVNYPYLSLLDCSKTKSQKGFFLCPKFQFCIDVKLVCDGINHCFHHEDELNCGLFFPFHKIVFFFNIPKKKNYQNNNFR